MATKTKAVSAKTQALLDAIREDDSQKPTQDKLEKVRDKVRECRDLELENASMAEKMAHNSKRIRELKDRELVDLFDEVRIDNLGLPPEGNVPAYEIELKPYYHANITDEKAPDAFAWLRKKKHGDLIKATYTIAFGMGQEKNQKSFESMLKKAKIEYSSKFGVPWNSLTAWLKEQVEVHKVTPPLDLLGATIGRVAVVKKQKKDRK